MATTLNPETTDEPATGGCPFGHDAPARPLTARDRRRGLLPAPLGWHRTDVSSLGSWRHALGIVAAGVRSDPFDAIAALPGAADDMVVARAPITRVVVIRDPEQARHVLVTHADNYVKGDDYDLLGVGLGRGLVTNRDEASWRPIRRTVQPVFAKRHVDRFAPAIGRATEEMLDRWQPRVDAGERIDVADEMNLVTMDVVTRTMLGVAVDLQDARRLRDAFAALLPKFGLVHMTGFPVWNERLASLLWKAGPWRDRPENPRLAIDLIRAGVRVVMPRAFGGLRDIERFVERLIREHRDDPTIPRDSVLGLLRDAEDPETGKRLTDLQLRDELVTLLGAGHETTASGLAWTWKLLADHPEIMRRLRDEVDTTLDGRAPTAADIDAMPYLRAVIQEAMRCYAPILAVARQAVEDDVVDGIEIPAGSKIIVYIHGINRNGVVWEDPERFHPERFLGDRAKQHHKQAAMPFGAGKRMCVAQGFSNLEAAIIVAMTVQRYAIDPVPQETPSRDITFTGGPSGPIWMKARRRWRGPRVTRVPDT
ncbi:MAG: cytochrome P450 [Solirubrobacteraceae bacterium]